jgi:type I restriction enzyme, S subunit
MTINLTLLRNVASLFNGKTPSRDEQRNTGHPVLKIRDIDEEGRFYGSFNSFVDDEFFFRFESKRLQIGDCLILNAAHNCEYVGSKQYHVDQQVAGAIATGEWLIVRPNIKVLDPAFLRHWLTSRSAKYQIKNIVKGIHLYPKDVEYLQIPCPPLPEQKRIAAILDKADAIRRKRQQAVKLADEFLRSVFLDMFGDPVTNPKGWPTFRLKELIKEGDKINYGVVQPGSEYPEGVPIIRVGDLLRRKLIKDKLKKIDPKIDFQHKRSRLIGDEILIACVGSIGKIRVVGRSLAGCNIARAIARVRPTEKVSRLYLSMFLKTSFVQNYFIRETRTVSQPTLNIGMIENAPVLIPPIFRQKIFDDIYRKRELVREKYTTILAQNGKLINSLIQRAFRGEL